MNQTAASLCPSADQLAKLAAGSISEAEADKLFAHVENCSACQARIDELARKKDPVLAAVKKAPRHETPPTQDMQLSELIVNAQRHRGRDDTRSNRNSSTRVISEVDFVDSLRKSGLLPQNEIDQLLADLSWDRSKSSSDSSSLAKRLIHTHKLTAFQAKLLLRGRYKGLILGNYTILDKLGQGGMGSVFKARHNKMGRIVCLKVVNSAGRQSATVIDRFRNEARALASLTHPNIVVAHDANETNGIPYLVMEYIDGQDLSKRIKREGPLPVDDTLDVAIQVASALEYAHQKGVIHRDVKPHNIVAHRDDGESTMQVKVLDLGLARFDTLISDNPDASILAAMTNTGVVIGTVDYMSPEQALDSRNADPRSDIYSLGCTLYFLLIGRPPFSGETVMQRLVAHREERARSLCSFLKSDITPEFNSVVQKMLQKDPEDRYQTMTEVVADLQALKNGRPVSAKAVPKAVSSRTATSPSPQPPEPPPIIANTFVESPEDLAGESVTADDAGIVFGPVYLRTFAAAAVLSVAILVPLTIFWPRVQPLEVEIPRVRVGAELAMRNGGDGRALMIVSSKKYHTDEFSLIANQLQNRGVEVVVASTKYGTGEKEYGEETKAGFDNLNLVDVDANEYDAVIVIGGDNHELSHKIKANHQHIVRIVNSALEANIAVTSCSCRTLTDGTLFNDKRYHLAPRRQAGNKEDLWQFLDDYFTKLEQSNKPQA